MNILGLVLIVVLAIAIYSLVRKNRISKVVGIILILCALVLIFGAAGFGNMV